jgi:hypothetical protein
VAAAAYAIWLASAPVVEALSNTPAVPDAEAMAHDLAARISAADRICAEFPADTTVRYYLWRDLTAPAISPLSAPPGAAASAPRPAALPGRAYLVFHSGSATRAAWAAHGLHALATHGDLVLYTGTDSADLENHVAGNCWTSLLETDLDGGAVGESPLR